MLLTKLYSLKINKKNYSVKLKDNTTLIQLCQIIGIEIPRFCYHERLSIAGNCRMCLVEIKNSLKPGASCALPIMNNMEFFTDSFLVKKAREGILEFLLINHPLDCPVCDQGGECDLQDQALIFGGDRGRFYELKRAVKDKNCGPLVKTSMNRCIHCTRCVRFSVEIAGVSELGTLGRGSKTEIGTYINNLLTSEISANIIDLCPVGALTLKPEAFNRRSWEIESVETIDIFDSTGSNIRVDFKNFEIIRILPRLNEKINEEWITDKVRFAYDGLKRQRILFPMLRSNNNYFIVSWKTSFEYIRDILIKNSLNLNNFYGIIGNLNSLDTIYFFKLFLANLGTINFIRDNKNSNLFNSDFMNTFLFNTKINNIKFSDLCLLLGVNPRVESPIINLNLRKIFKHKIIGFLGHNLNLNYKVKFLGNNFKNFIKLIQGKHWFCNFLTKSKHPLLIIGSGIFSRSDSLNFYFLFNFLNKFVSYFTKNWYGLNFLINSVGEINALYLGFVKSKNSINYDINNFYYLVGSFDDNSTTIISKNLLLQSNLTVFQGHTGNSFSSFANVILPSSTFLDNNEFFLNCEGVLQRTQRAFFPLKESRIDSEIFKMLSVFLGFSKDKITKDYLFITYYYNKFFSLNWKKSYNSKKFKIISKINQLVFHKLKVFSNDLINNTNCLRSFNSEIAYNSNISKLKVNNFIVNSILNNFYMTDNITKSSLVMSLCVKEQNKKLNNLIKI